MKQEITPQELNRIGGFLGCDKTEYAKRLGISLPYLSRILGGRDPLTERISEAALELLNRFVKENPHDPLVVRISEIAILNLPKEATLSLPFLRQLWQSYTDEDFKRLSQRKRTFVHERKMQDRGITDY